MIRTQISVDSETYKRAQEVARQQGISLAELSRRGLEAIIAKQPVAKPWMAFAGVIAGSTQDSSSVDEIVYGRLEP